MRSRLIIDEMGGAPSVMLRRLPLLDDIVRDLIIPKCLNLELHGGNGRKLEKRANELRSICCQFKRNVEAHQQVWRDIYCFRFRRAHSGLRVKSWYQHYQRRVQNLRDSPLDDKDGEIEGCSLTFECPMRFEKLNEIPGTEKERFCDICQKVVHKTDSIETLKMLARQGECVSFVSSKMLGRDMTPHQQTGCWVV